MRFVETLVLIAVTTTSSASFGAEGDGAAAMPYDFTLGGAPSIYASATSFGLGAAFEAEITTTPPWFPLARIGGGSFQEKHPEDRGDHLKKRADASVEVGARYYFKPFLSSWQASTTVVAGRTTSTYEPGGSRSDVKRTATSLALHPAGGYRWLWPSGLFVLLGTGVAIPVYDVGEDVENGDKKGRAFWGPWTLMGMSAIGVGF